MAKKDASIIHSLETNLKVVDEKDASINALESKLAEMQINLMEKEDAIKTLMRQLEEEKTIVTV